MNITLNHISFAYEDRSVIKDLSCSFLPGNFYSIIGPNGSGKTTMIDLISGFLTPGTGRICIGKKTIQSLSKKEISQRIALVSQDYAINFPFSVKEVVMMGRHPYVPRFSHPSSQDVERVERVMEICGIRHFQDRRITELSGGEKQRCIFARALCQDTPILLLDEAFSNMDICHTLQMLRLVKQSVKEEGKLVISVFHDLNLASTWSDALVMIKNGEIKAFGETQTILTKESIQDVFDIAVVVKFNDYVQARQVYYPKI